jgi:hypothetical protein
MRWRMLFVGLFLLSAASLTAQVSAPVVVKEVRPQYTPEAERRQAGPRERDDPNGVHAQTLAGSFSTKPNLCTIKGTAPCSMRAR